MSATPNAAEKEAALILAIKWAIAPATNAFVDDVSAALATARVEASKAAAERAAVAYIADVWMCDETDARRQLERIRSKPSAFPVVARLLRAGEQP